MSGWDPEPEPKIKQRDPAIVRAELNGFRIIAAASNQLQLDLDGGRQINAEVYERLVNAYCKPEHEEWRSKSGVGRHVVLTFKAGLFKKNPEFDDAQATALEVALGSDPMRGLSNILRIKYDYKEVRVLFRPSKQMEAKLEAAYGDLTQEQHVQVFTAAERLLA